MIDSLEGHGGSERSLTLRCNFLVEYFQYEITIITTQKGALVSYYKLHPAIRVVNIPYNSDYNIKKVFRILSLIPFNESEGELADFIKIGNFDICSSLSSTNFLFIHCHNSFIKIKEQRFTYQKYHSQTRISFPKRVWRAIRLKRFVRTLKRMDHVITLTEEDSKYWRSNGINVTTIPNFINLDRISCSSLQNKVIVAAGRLEEVKDYFSLIEAFKIVVKKFPDWILKICGDGSLYQQLIDQVHTEGLSKNVILEGAVENIFEEYGRSSIFVHTAHYEGFGNSILEALAHGLPVVAFESVGGVKALIEDGNNGFLVQNRNVSDLADRMMMLIEDFDLRKRMGRSSISVAKRYEEDKVMSMWHDFYSNL